MAPSETPQPSPQVSAGEQVAIDSEQLAAQTMPAPTGENPFLMTAEERAASTPKANLGYVDHNPVRIGGPEQSQVPVAEAASPVATPPAEAPAAPAMPEYPAGVTPATPETTLKPGDVEVTNQPPVVRGLEPAFTPAYPSSEEVAASQQAQQPAPTPASEATAARIATTQPEFTPTTPTPITMEGLSEERKVPANPIQFTSEAAVDAAKTVSQTPPTVPTT